MDRDKMEKRVDLLGEHADKMLELFRNKKNPSKRAVMIILLEYSIKIKGTYKEETHG